MTTWIGQESGETVSFLEKSDLRHYGHEYDYCLNSPGTGLWCATALKKDGQWKDWGICSPGCPNKVSADEKLQSGTYHF